MRVRIREQESNRLVMIIIVVEALSFNYWISGVSCPLFLAVINFVTLRCKVYF